MKRRVVGLTILGLAGIVGSSALAATPSSYARPGNFERVSVSSAEEQSKNPLPVSSLDGHASITPDGRYVAFASDASNLVPGDRNASSDIFVRDRVRGTTNRVSVATGGAEAIGWFDPVRQRHMGSDWPVISADGRYVAFHSQAINLGPEVVVDPLRLRSYQVYRHDIRTGITTLVSLTRDGRQRGNNTSQTPGMSADGRYILWNADATDLVAQDTNSARDIFVRDMVTGRTTLESVNSKGEQGQSTASLAGLGLAPHVNYAAISANGRYLTFASPAGNMVEGIPPSEQAVHLYWRDRKTGVTRLASVNSQGERASFAGIPTCVVQVIVCASDPGPWMRRAITPDGRFVAFRSSATNLVPNDNLEVGGTYGQDMFVHDMVTGRTERVSVDSNGKDVWAASTEGSISNDGRFIAYTLVGPSACLLAGQELPGGGSLPSAGCTVAGSLTYARASISDAGATTIVYDRRTGASEVMSLPLSGKKATSGRCRPESVTRGSGSHTSDIRPDGREVVFFSSVTNLVAGDTNDACDYIVRDRGRDLAVGGLGGPVAQTTSPGSPSTCILDLVCVPPTTTAKLLASSVVPREGLRDLFVRWDLARLDPTSTLLYELSFTNGRDRFAVRAQRRESGASFGLFRETAPGVWTHVSDLKGGYGTIGDSVVTAVPLSLLGGAAQLTDVTAYTAVGSYLSGPTKVLDSIKLTRSASSGR